MQVEGAGRTTCAAKELLLMTPGVERFRKTETVEALLFTVIISGFPSPSRSATAVYVDPAPAVKLTGGANELLLMTPGVPMLRRTETSPGPPQLKTMSARPSPSISVITMP